jgi:hypothetical protein
MRYLMRAARRSTAVGVTQVRPAIPSRSPLVEADQRLNLDSFAAQFTLPSTRERNAQPLEDEEPFPLPSSEQQAVRNDAAESPSSPTGDSERKTRRVTSRSEFKQTETLEEADRESPSNVSTQPEAHSARPREQPVRRASETSTASQQSPARQTRRVNALPAPASAEGHAPAPAPARAESSRVAGREQTPAAEAAAEPVLSALNRAMAWVEGQPPRTREAGRGDERMPPTSTAPRPRFGETLPSRPGRATPRDRRPMTHLEIGKIEVEIMPPQKPAPQTASSRPAQQKTPGFGSALRQTFGWRQR